MQRRSTAAKSTYAFTHPLNLRESMVRKWSFLRAVLQTNGKAVAKRVYDIEKIRS
jgi:hypothetical protein